jgi:hypothetical protein
MAESCGEPYDSSDEYDRDERIETIYQGWGAREMAERIVDLEDELGADVDGICTGMHADVAEAQSAWEDERLRADRFEAAWRSARRRASRAMGAWRYMRWREDAQSEEMREQDEYARWLWDQFVERGRESDRYRLAWLSARRRAADEANFGMEALALRDAEIARLKAVQRTIFGMGNDECPRHDYAHDPTNPWPCWCAHVRKTTHGTARLASGTRIR